MKIRVVLLVTMLAFGNPAFAQNRLVNGWTIVDRFREGICLMHKSVGSTTFQFEPAHGKVRTYFSITDMEATLVSGPVGMGLRVPSGGPTERQASEAALDAAFEPYLKEEGL